MKISKVVDFCAAHSIKGAGKCANKHGHNWTAIIEVESVGGELSDVRGFLADVRDLKQAAFKYDHDDLDKYFDFASTENVAKKIAEDALDEVLKCNPNLHIFVRVHLDETKNNSADAVATNVEYKKLNRTHVTTLENNIQNETTSHRWLGFKGAAQDYESEFKEGQLRKPDLDKEHDEQLEMPAEILFGGAKFQNKGH